MLGEKQLEGLFEIHPTWSTQNLKKTTIKKDDQIEVIGFCPNPTRLE